MDPGLSIGCHLPIFSGCRAPRACASRNISVPYRAPPVPHRKPVARGPCAVVCGHFSGPCGCVLIMESKKRSELLKYRKKVSGGDLCCASAPHDPLREQMRDGLKSERKVCELRIDCFRAWNWPMAWDTQNNTQYHTPDANINIWSCFFVR